MRKYPFTIENEDDLIIIDVTINGYDVKLALDTAATHTVIDYTALVLAGGHLNKVGKTKLETASGTIEAEKFVLQNVTALGIEETDFEVTSYDFLLYGLLIRIDGVLGLDFFRDKVLTIDFKKQVLWVHEE